MNWLKEHALAIVDTLAGLAGLLLAYLAFYGLTGDDFPQFGPEPVAQFITDNKGAIYILAAALVLWSLFRLIRRAWMKTGELSRADKKRIDEDFQSIFAKCPYWIKVFLKTVQFKDAAYSDANSFYFENYLEFLLQFVDYKTVSGNVWQYSMSDDAKRYFDNHPQLLSGVTDEEVRRHARRKDERVVAHTGTEFYWWYYSDEDYIEPIAWSDSSNPFTIR